LLQPEDITVTDYGFFAISPKGKVIRGITCFAYLPASFGPNFFRFNGELFDYLIFSPKDAASFLARKGMLEARKRLTTLTRVIRMQ